MNFKNHLSLLAGPVAGLLVYFLLLRDSVPGEVRLLSAITTQTVVWWFLEAMSPAVAGLFFASLCVLFGIGTPEKVFAPFANPIIYFFLGGFFVAKAIETHGVAERILHALDSAPYFKGHPYRMAAAMIVFTTTLSAFLNNTATAALVLPFAVTLAKKYFYGDPKSGVHLILAVAYASSLGGMMTVFGTAPNLISLGILKQTTGEVVSFWAWMKYALPISLPPILFLIGRQLWYGRNYEVKKDVSQHQYQGLQLTVAAQRSLGVLGLAMVLLMGVSLIPSMAFIGEMNAILLPALLLFVIPAGSRPGSLLTWKEATEIDWSCLILFGAGMCMGSLMFSTGLAKLFGESLSAIGQQPHLFLIALVVSVVVITTFASNTASVTLLVPLALAVAKESQLPTLPTALAVALAASFGLTLPVGTPPNALAYGTGMVTTRQMIRKGIVLDLMGMALAILVFWFCF